MMISIALFFPPIHLLQNMQSSELIVTDHVLTSEELNDLRMNSGWEDSIKRTQKIIQVTITTNFFVFIQHTPLRTNQNTVHSSHDRNK